MADSNVKVVVGIVISLIVIAVMMPLALGLISTAGDYVVSNVTNAAGNVTTTRYLKDVCDPAVITLLTVLLPIMAVISVTMYFINK